MKADPATETTVFLMADAVGAAKAAQKTPDGCYNVERMLKRVLVGKGKVLLCGTCMDARGITDAELGTGAQRSTMDELAAATLTADKVLVFWGISREVANDERYGGNGLGHGLDRSARADPGRPWDRRAREIPHVQTPMSCRT
jgi:uncharacterized protein involved in oxidation of intracellular sulfur